MRAPRRVTWIVRPSARARAKSSVAPSRCASQEMYFPSGENLGWFAWRNAVSPMRMLSDSGKPPSTGTAQRSDPPNAPPMRIRLPSGNHWGAPPTTERIEVSSSAVSTAGFCCAAPCSDASEARKTIARWRIIGTPLCQGNLLYSIKYSVAIEAAP